MFRSIIIFIFSAGSFLFFAQQTEKHIGDYVDFYRGEELFEKAQYSTARKEFRTFIEKNKNENDPLYIKALYYEGISALELFNNDAIPLLEDFNKRFPENIYRYQIGFRIGKYFFQKEDFEGAQKWLEKVPVKELDSSQRDELNFKLGYASYLNGDKETAYSSFRDSKDGKSQYAAPSLYFYSHLSYLKNSLQVALDGFLSLRKDSTFCGVVPYYIVQIYHKQARYQDVVDFAPTVLSCSYINNESDIQHIIGNSHYKLGNYDKCIGFLEQYQTKQKPSRDDAYELGYAYYQTKNYEKAIRSFDKVTRVDDSLGQIALYHIAECYQNLEKLLPARSAFERASEMTKIPEIQEDALYNFAVISFKVDINPYDESVRAFENYLLKYPNSKRKEDVFQYLVNVYTSTSNFAKALESLDKLPNKDARLKRVYQTVAFNYGVELFQKNTYHDALNAFKLVDRYPLDPKLVALSKYWIADIHFRNNEMSDAIVTYREFINSPASDALAEKVDAYYNMGYAHLKKEEVEEAIKIFRIYLQSDPKNAEKKLDANFRVADGYYTTEKNDLAIQFYTEALKMNTSLNDKALYYLAKSYGYNNQPLENIKNLTELVTKYKKSKYVMNATYDLGRAHVGQANYDEALQIFKQFIIDFPKSSLLIDARLSIADLHYKKWDYNQAEAEYLKILNEYEKVRDVCEETVKGLIDVYAAKKQPEKASELADRYSCANISADEKENLFFSPAFQSYMDSTYSEAISKFETYLSRFPAGRFVNETYYYLGNCYFKQKDTLKAVQNFEKYLETPITNFSESAASRTAAYYYNHSDYINALKYYERFDQLASKPTNIFNARLGVMRCAYLTDDFNKALSYAKFILETPSINTQQKIEGEYSKGMSNFKLNNYTDAIPSLEWLVKNTTTAIGSESKYTLAEIYFKQSQFGQADSEIKALIKMKPSYNYWVAKGLILQTRIHIINDDLFQAEQNLKSVIDFYPTQDDGILSEANDLWDELMQLKNPPIIEEPENEKKIEINEE
jgi:tetratricopeptide (TPR) repeat protein